MLIRSTGIVAGILLVFAVCMIGYTIRNPQPVPRDMKPVRMPVLAMEFVRSEADLHRIIGEPRDTDPEVRRLREWLKTNIRIDYGFIALYWLLFVLIAGVLAQREGRWMPWLGAAAGLAITGAAIADVMENVRMTRVIDTVQLAGNDVASAGFAKWVLSFVAIGLLAFAFVGRHGWIPWIGGVCVLIAVVGLAGLVALRMGPGGLPIVQLAFFLMLVPLLPMVFIAFNFSPGAFRG
ncbi:hypothetical protein [Longimicrobium sp.]|uniref:hypothetical protein n=1 Tax=Longimicrobium sp. TaxID=2029185 RepID=UPI002E31FB47|nr:hypothetical protein [Longimicrobium sp.]HEX6040459.1 hypothetical protein [Longimicrobium sp.]